MAPDQQLVGKRITEVREMTKEEMFAEGWGERDAPIVLVIEDGTKLYASRDHEGNGPGALFSVQPDKTYLCLG